jgi:lauroyl/myristoyl acyltransferase
MKPPPGLAPFARRNKRTLLQRISNSFWKRFLAISYFPSILVFRFIERCFGPTCLPVVVTPVIYLDLLRRLVDYREFKRVRAVLPDDFWRGLSPWRHYLIMIRNWQSTLATWLLADRLHLPQWISRFEVSGTPPHQLPEWGARPVLLVYMHLGGYGLLRSWMRAQGVTAGCYSVGRPTVINLPWAEKIVAQAGAVHGLGYAPYTFLGPHRLRDMIKFLIPGRLVTIALDSESQSTMIYQAGGKYPMRVSEGIVRLAALTHAVLLPVSVLPRGIGRFHVRFRTPVPDELIDEKQPRAATQFLLDQLWKDIEAEPSGLGWASLEQLAVDLTINHHVPFP